MLTLLSKAKLQSTDPLRLETLDNISANIMIADVSRDIVYMNKAVSGFLASVERDIQKDLPHFKADALIGKSIDIFHKRPEHQQRMLDGMTQPHRATIQVGGKQFDLLAVPVFDDKRRRLGTFVEWLDATQRLENFYFSALSTAMSRSQAVIEFNMDGTIITANDNFLRTLGYTLAEIQGQHHGIFAEPAYRSSHDYRAFWEKLNRGEFDSGQYKRLGKGGKEVWIEASYNPILDERGKPYKVVKYATDITERVKTGNIIGHNMREIDTAVVRLNQQSDSVMASVSETTTNVQTVAASSEEMAASVREISESMSRSRAAAEQVTTKVHQADDATQKLAQAAKAMSGIVEMIEGIAGQINMLALNATIESARAGEAGRGFAVVATEVKNLAGQAAGATKKIGDEIENIQHITQGVVDILTSIKRDIQSVSEHVTSTASAVEEQSAVTSEIAANMQTASKAVGDIATGMSEVAAALQQASHAISATKEAASTLTVR